MTLGRTSSGAIKIKTDGGLRAVECACCVVNPCIKPTSALMAILANWTTVQIDYIFPATEYNFPARTGTFYLTNGCFQDPESGDYICGPPNGNAETEYDSTFTYIPYDDVITVEYTMQARVFVTDEGYIYLDLEDLLSGDRIRMYCGEVDTFYERTTVAINGRPYPASWSDASERDGVVGSATLTFS